MDSLVTLNVFYADQIVSQSQTYAQKKHDPEDMSLFRHKRIQMHYLNIRPKKLSPIALAETTSE